MKNYLLFIFLLIFENGVAQVEDHFDDGDFSNSPAWNGDNSEFNVNAAGQLQLNATNSGNSFLSVPANLSTLDSCEWRFFIKLSFSPSSSNYARVYLSSDQSDLQQPLNGYYLQFGESLSNDAIELFRQNGTNITSIFRGQESLISYPFSAGVRVQRNNSGKWKLSVDYNGGTNYIPQAIGNDTTFNDAAFLGIHCVYTIGNINRFYLDDFYAGPEIPDTVLPDITNINAESSTILSVTFSEKMDSISMSQLNNYSVDNGIGQPSYVALDNLNPLNYFLHFSIPFQSNIIYSISFSELKDINQNRLIDNIRRFSFFPLAKANLDDVVFSEIYFEPSSLSPLPNSEFIELYNRKDSSVYILGWKVSDGSSDGLIPAFRLGPHSFVVLYSVNDSLEFLSTPNALAVDFFPTLNNDFGDHIFLTDSDGQLINELEFNDMYYHDAYKKNGGWTIERIDEDFTCKNEENWKASISNAHGTPGLINSTKGGFMETSPPFVSNIFLYDSITLIVIFNEAVERLEDLQNFQVANVIGSVFEPISAGKICDDTIELKFSSAFSSGLYTLRISSKVKDCPGNSIDTNCIVKFGFPENSEPKDILINELLFNPTEDGVDFLELYNASTKIIDLMDWVISKADFDDSLNVKDEAIISQKHLLFFPEEYLVLTKDEKDIKKRYLYKSCTSFLKVASMPDYNSNNGRANIYNQNGRQIDAFRYSDEMHFSLLSDVTGISLERLSVVVTNDNSLNWHSAAATVGFATPGYRNSQRLDLEVGDDEVSLGMEVFSPDNDGYSDVLAIHYKFPQTGTVLSLSVYDYNGQEIRKLLSGLTVSSEGTIFWDGLSEENLIAPSGIYVLLAQSFDLKGEGQVIKKTCFLTRRF